MTVASGLSDGSATDLLGVKRVVTVGIRLVFEQLFESANAVEKVRGSESVRSVQRRVPPVAPVDT